MNTETLLAIGYAVFLAVISGVLELTARHVHRRSQQTSTVGFTYHRELDVWECPDGRSLHRESVDQGLRLVRYRAEAHHCNGCAFKFRCTDSNAGRVIEHRPNAWLESGMSRFHRGMSLLLLLLAVMLLVVELLRNYGTDGEIALAAATVCIGTLGVRLLSAFRAASS